MRRAAEEGYTLLELLVVMAIIALISAVGAATFPNRTDAVELTNSARRAASLLNKVRDHARTTQSIVAAAVADDGHALHVGDRIVTVADDIEIKLRSPSGQPSIIFYPDGSSSGGLVRLRSGTAEERVAVNWFTGLARVEQQ